jgi:hypothetical protein
MNSFAVDVFTWASAAGNQTNHEPEKNAHLGAHYPVRLLCRRQLIQRRAHVIGDRQQAAPSVTLKNMTDAHASISYTRPNKIAECVSPARRDELPHLIVPPAACSPPLRHGLVVVASEAGRESGRRVCVELAE